MISLFTFQEIILVTNKTKYDRLKNVRLTYDLFILSHTDSRVEEKQETRSYILKLDSSGSHTVPN